MTELRKCPFCGGEAKIGRIFGHESVYCTKCDACILPSPYDTEDELNKSIEAWNKRVPQEENQDWFHAFPTKDKEKLFKYISEKCRKCGEQK
jgi:hypothetical protein